MKKTILALLILSLGVMADVTNVEVSSKFVDENKTKIIDIRTQSEWEEIGTIAGSYLITFFTKDKAFHGELFLKELNDVIEKDEVFAVISNTASRSKLVSNFLGKKNSYHVINLEGGISKLVKEGYVLEKYNPQKKEIAPIEVAKESASKEEEMKPEVVKKEDTNCTKA